MCTESLKKLDPQCAQILESAIGLFEDAAKDGSDEVAIVRKYTALLMDRFSSFGESSEIVSTDVTVTSATLTDVPARLYKSASSGAEQLILFFHGGGWSVGDIDGYDPFVRALCADTGINFLSVDYRRAPEFKFPAAHDDCFNATLWAFENSEELGVDPNKISLMGDSAGGAIATNVAWRMAHQPEYRIQALYLFYPFLDVRDKPDLYPSRQEFGGGEYLIDRDGLALTVSWYFGGDEDLASPSVSPLFIDDLSCLPETVIVTADCDPLRDEGLLFAKNLAESGVSVHSKNFAGAIHGFLAFGSLDVAQEAKRWLIRRIGELGY